MKFYCIAQGTLLNVMWQPGWENSLGENGFMYMSLHCPPETVTMLLIGYGGFRNWSRIAASGPVLTLSWVLREVSGRQLLVFIAQSCLTLCEPMDGITPVFPVLHHLPELAEPHAHCVSDATQPYHTLLSPSPPAFYLSEHHSLFQWVSSLHQVAKILELQLRHHSS